MSHTITKDCIACGRCVTVCPTGAVKPLANGVVGFQIDNQLCHDCVGFYGTPQCEAGCPTNNGSVPVTADDYWSSWFQHYNRRLKVLQGGSSAAYWEQWFERYSQKVAQLMQTQPEFMILA